MGGESVDAETPENSVIMQNMRVAATEKARVRVKCI